MSGGPEASVDPPSEGDDPAAARGGGPGGEPSGEPSGEGPPESRTGEADAIVGPSPSTESGPSSCAILMPARAPIGAGMGGPAFGKAGELARGIVGLVVGAVGTGGNALGCERWFGGGICSVLGCSRPAVTGAGAGAGVGARAFIGGGAPAGRGAEAGVAAGTTNCAF